jgi:hypothetical protein
MPLGCHTGAWAKGSPCIERARGVVIELYPRIESDPKTVTATPAPIYMEGSGEHEPGLRMPGRTVRSERMLDALLGFATVGTPHPVRFTSAVARRLEKEAAEWCQENRCDGRVTSPMLKLAERAPSADASRAAERLVLRKLVKEFAAPPRIVSTSMFEVRIAGGSRALIDVGVAIVPDQNRATEFPSELHFLLSSTDAGFERLKSIGAYTYELGETGALLAAVDLDGDGTDELIVEWAYGEGRWYRFARMAGAELVVIGEFGVGS